VSARRQFALTLPVKQYSYRKPVKFTTNLVFCPEVDFGFYRGQQGATGGFFNRPLPPETEFTQN
jgi:hypothetical protein